MTAPPDTSCSQAASADDFEPMRRSEIRQVMRAPVSPSSAAPSPPTRQAFAADCAPPNSATFPDFAMADEDTQPMDHWCQLAPMSLERCATIAASLDLQPEGRAHILANMDLTSWEWEREHARWMEIIDRGTVRDEDALLQRYDQSYVAELERQRGPVTATEFIRLVSAVHKGASQRVCSALGIPEAADMRVRRECTHRVTRDPEARASYHVALNAIFANASA